MDIYWNTTWSPAFDIEKSNCASHIREGLLYIKTSTYTLYVFRP